MSKYKLVAFDMDGTLLNSKKEIVKDSIHAIQKAVSARKEVILSTGRGPAELTDYICQIPGLRYLDCLSGAMVYDLKEKKIIYSNPLQPEIVKNLLEIAKEEDTMIHFLTNDSIVQKSDLENMGHYNMSIYKSMFEKITQTYENIYETYHQNPFPVAKLNIYHTSTDSRRKTEERIKQSGLAVSMVYSEFSSLEVSAQGVNKGTGLKKLCQHLGLSIEETIAVGDADNDTDILKTAGLAVAMGNAKDSIKAIADVVVSDCDHNGCVEVIQNYLL